MKAHKRQQLNPLLKQQALEKLLAGCPFCQNQQAHFITSIISANQSAELVHARCQSCQAAMVALLFSTGPMISSIGLLTDLTLEDVSKFQHHESLSEDDLITLHEGLHVPSLIEQLLKQV